MIAQGVADSPGDPAKLVSHGKDRKGQVLKLLAEKRSQNVPAGKNITTKSGRKNTLTRTVIRDTTDGDARTESHSEIWRKRPYDHLYDGLRKARLALNNYRNSKLEIRRAGKPPHNVFHPDTGFSLDKLKELKDERDKWVKLINEAKLKGYAVSTQTVKPHLERMGEPTVTTGYVKLYEETREAKKASYDEFKRRERDEEADEFKHEVARLKRQGKNRDARRLFKLTGGLGLSSTTAFLRVPHGNGDNGDHVEGEDYKKDFVKCMMSFGVSKARRKCLFNLHPDKGGVHEQFVWGSNMIDCVEAGNKWEKCFFGAEYAKAEQSYSDGGPTPMDPGRSFTTQLLMGFAMAFLVFVLSRAILIKFVTWMGWTRTRLLQWFFFCDFIGMMAFFWSVLRTPDPDGTIALRKLCLEFIPTILWQMCYVRYHKPGNDLDFSLLKQTTQQRVFDKIMSTIGCGRGKSFISKACRHGGTGGKSKVRRDAQPPLGLALGRDPNDVDDEIDDETLSSDGSFDWDEYDKFVEALIKQAIFADFPTSRSLSKAPDYTRTYRYDCYGAPFCGLGCIDIACKRKPDTKFYTELNYGDYDIVQNLGGSEYLKNYAAHRGVNIIIYNSIGIILTMAENDPKFKWVQLQYEEPVGEDEYGHYVLRVEKVGDNINLELPDFPRFSLSNISAEWMMFVLIGMDVFLFLFWRFFRMSYGYIPFEYHFQFYRWWKFYCECRWFFKLVLMLIKSVDFSVGIKLVKYMYNETNEDVRPINARREKLVHHDYYADLNYDVCFRVWVVRSWRWFRVFEWGLGVVSVARLVEAYDEGVKCFASGRDFKLCLPTATRLRELNTRCDLGGLLVNVKEVLLFCDKCFSQSVMNKPISTAGLIQWNEDGNRAILAGLHNIAANQAAINLQGAGTVKYGRSNYVKKYRLKESKNKPCNVAPIGCVVTNEGPLYPGLFNITDSPSLLSAFMGRSMNKELVQVKSFFEFSIFYHRVVEKIADSVDFSRLVEWTDVYDLVNKYRAHNLGKKSSKEIESRVDSYLAYVHGHMRPKDVKKFESGSCFVKYEANTKKVGSKYAAKPRLIMTMPDKYSVELVQLLEVHDLFYHSKWGEHLVKHLEPEEMIRRIFELTGLEHNTTDYSSFECSISETIRSCEMTTQCALLSRAGLFKTCAAFKRYVNEEDVLRTKFGEFVIHTRRSGDYDTGYSNAMTNYVLALWMAKLNGVIPNILVEGDDGLMRSDNLNVEAAADLGFKMGTNVSGTSPGDVDFLCSRWVMADGGGKRLLNVGKMMRGFWVKEGAKLSTGKQKFILRAMALSLHALSPGHPILFAMVNRILRLTSGVNKFKNWENYIKSYNSVEIDWSVKTVVVDESMRSAIAEGGIGFPPIPIYIQHILEDRFSDLSQEVYIGMLLDDYDEILAFKASNPQSSKRRKDTWDVANAWKLIKDPILYLNKMDIEEDTYADDVLMEVIRDQGSIDEYAYNLSRTSTGFKVDYGANDCQSNNVNLYKRIAVLEKKVSDLRV